MKDQNVITYWTADNSLGAIGKLAIALDTFHTVLPGWWVSVGECSTSYHASCGLDRMGQDAHLLGVGLFDRGFHVEIGQPSTMADVVNYVQQQALSALRSIVGRE